MPNSSRDETERPHITYNSCPPEHGAPQSAVEGSDNAPGHTNMMDCDDHRLQTADPDTYLSSSVASSTPSTLSGIADARTQQYGGRATTPFTDAPSPASSHEAKHQEYVPYLGASLSSRHPAYNQDFTDVRMRPAYLSSNFRAGSKFLGTQHSERQVYDVSVEIKHVDMRESFLCGYLRIQGLTPDHPTLTTYFEGEIIGTQYSFLTQHKDWAVDDKVDLQHWAKFLAFRPYQKACRRGRFHIPNSSQKENVFMRWKEKFLVPDHRVKTINGASFEGFYYICFNQVAGTVSGIYFHKKSEKFQQLELKHVEDRGCFAAMEFR